MAQVTFFHSHRLTDSNFAQNLELRYQRLLCLAMSGTSSMNAANIAADTMRKIEHLDCTLMTDSVMKDPSEVRTIKKRLVARPLAKLANMATKPKRKSDKDKDKLTLMQLVSSSKPMHLYVNPGSEPERHNISRRQLIHGWFR